MNLLREKFLELTYEPNRDRPRIAATQVTAWSVPGFRREWRKEVSSTPTEPAEGSGSALDVFVHEAVRTSTPFGFSERRKPLFYRSEAVTDPMDFGPAVATWQRVFSFDLDQEARRSALCAGFCGALAGSILVNGVMARAMLRRPAFVTAPWPRALGERGRLLVSITAGLTGGWLATGPALRAQDKRSLQAALEVDLFRQAARTVQSAKSTCRRLEPHVAMSWLLQGHVARSVAGPAAQMHGHVADWMHRNCVTTDSFDSEWLEGLIEKLESDNE